MSNQRKRKNPLIINFYDRGNNLGPISFDIPKYTKYRRMKKQKIKNQVEYQTNQLKNLKKIEIKNVPPCIINDNHYIIPLVNKFSSEIRSEQQTNQENRNETNELCENEEVKKNIEKEMNEIFNLEDNFFSEDDDMFFFDDNDAFSL